MMSLTPKSKGPISQTQDDFINSMTFASSNKNCECDDCGDICELPVSIAEAVETFNRNRLIHETNYQQRDLVLRESGVSIWKMTLPPGAEPLRELGGQHRLLLVSRIPKGRAVKSMGTGVVGSAEEEKGRTMTNWKEASAFFLKSNGGKLIGWINDKMDDGDKVAGDQDVILYTFKTTDSALDGFRQKSVESTSPESGTRNVVLQLLCKYLDNGELELEAEDVASLQKIIDENAVEEN